MVEQDRAAKAKSGKWELYEKLNGGKHEEKDVVLSNPSSGFAVSIQREEFKEMVKRYFAMKGY